MSSRGLTFLPESQLDRFMLRLRMGYPIRSEERKVFASHRDGEPVESFAPVLTAKRFFSFSMACEQSKWMTPSPNTCLISCMRLAGAKTCMWE